MVRPNIVLPSRWESIFFAAGGLENGSFTERVRAESEEQKKKTDAIFTSEETVAALLKHIQGVSKKS